MQHSNYKFCDCRTNSDERKKTVQVWNLHRYKSMFANCHMCYWIVLCARFDLIKRSLAAVKISKLFAFHIAMRCVEWTVFDIAKRQTDLGGHNRFHFITELIASNLWLLLGIVRCESTTIAMALIKRIFETIYLIFGLQFDKSKHLCLKSILNRVQQRKICIMHCADIQLNIFPILNIQETNFENDNIIMRKFVDSNKRL